MFGCFSFLCLALEGADPSNTDYLTVQALMTIKNLLMDPHGVLKNWDKDSVDPCSWTTVTCSPDKLVTGL